MLLKDHWYVVCPSNQLAENELRSVQIGDKNLVVYRDDQGAARTLLDRCCHRGAKLSLGRITGGRIACGYHGWQYDREGKLAFVPSLPKGAKTPSHCVPSYTTVEVDHYVWVWISGEHDQPTYQPDMPILADMGGVWSQRTEIWDVPIMDAVENQLDYAHTPYSHPGIYPGHDPNVGYVPPLNDFVGEFRILDGGIVLFDPPVENADIAVPSWRDVNTWARFEFPYRNIVVLTSLGVVAIYNWVPLPGDKCRLEFMVSYQDVSGGRIEPCDGNTKQVEYMDEEIELLNQDRRILESAKQSILAGRSDYEVSVPSDFPQLQARRLHRAALDGTLDSSITEGKRHIFKSRI